jgi:hypothetical protein
MFPKLDDEVLNKEPKCWVFIGIKFKQFACCFYGRAASACFSIYYCCCQLAVGLFIYLLLLFFIHVNFTKPSGVLLVLT